MITANKIGKRKNAWLIKNELKEFAKKHLKVRSEIAMVRK